MCPIVVPLSSFFPSCHLLKTFEKKKKDKDNKNNKNNNDKNGTECDEIEFISVY